MENFQSIAIKMVRSSLPLLSFFEENHTASINPYPHMCTCIEKDQVSVVILATLAAPNLFYAKVTRTVRRRKSNEREAVCFKNKFYLII